VSGLLVIVGRGRYTASGDIVPDPSFAEYASQHLKSGYSSIAYLSSSDRTLFLEKVWGLIDTLKLGDEWLKGFCDECKERLPRRLTGRKRPA
jgi:hypothetical protein